ncbi:MAG: NADH-quinone oxidoreductase subunit C, partial [Propionibacteriaceae bacterium]|nr:NADH-quinone oxidoreductase subunit C [Propionibacteriaceae bacterium]
MSQESPAAEEAVAAAEPPVSPLPIATRRGMWTEGTGDTSGYGLITRTVEMPAGQDPPFGGWLDAAVARLGELVPGAVERVVFDRGELTVFVPRDKLLEAARQLRDDEQLRFEFLGRRVAGFAG